MLHNYNPHRFLALLLAAAVLPACGGGGGGGGSGASAPSALAYSSPRVIEVVDVEIGALVPSVQGKVDRYTITPPLPAGLAFNEANGVISGRATGVAATRAHTVHARNVHGSASTTLELTIAPAPRFAYVLSRADASVTLFTVDPASGRLLRKGYEAAEAGALRADQIRLHPSGRFLYVADAGNGHVTTFAIDELEGWLTRGSNTPAGPGPHRIALHPSGRFAFVTSRASDELHAFDVESVTGALVNARAPLLLGARPVDVELDPSGQFLFVAFSGADPTGAGAGIQAFTVDSATGALAVSGLPIELDGLAPFGLTVDPARNALYVALSGSDSVLPLRYNQSTGALAALAPELAGAHPEALAVDPLGRFTFVANEQGASISSYQVDDLSGALMPSGTAPAGANPVAVALDPAGRFLYVVNEGSDDVMLYAVSSVDGTLQRVDAWSARATPSDIVVVGGERAPVLRTRFLHVANADSDDVSAYTVEHESGAATEQFPTSTTSAGPSSVVAHPRYLFAWVVEREGRALGSYRIDGASGALVPNGPAILTPGTPWSAALEPSGRFLYLVERDVLVQDDGQLTTYAIDVTDGTLHFVQSQTIGSRPVHVAADPAGRFLHVANIGSPSSIQAFALAPATGLPVPSGPPAPAPGIHAITHHPSGRSLVAALRTSNALACYSIDPLNGTTATLANGSRAGREPLAVAFTADGRLAFAAFSDQQNQENGGHIGLFHVDPDGTLLPPGEAYQAGTHPTALVASPDGRFLYVTHSGTNSLTPFAIDATTTTLHPRPPIPTGLNPRSITLTLETR